MASRTLIRPGGLALALLATITLTPSHRASGQPPAKPEHAWTFEEARSRLALNPRDAYLQYVVLQMGRREGREQEAIQAVEGRSPLARLGLFGGRGRQTDLFATFTGALAIQESLQLDTMRGERGRQPVPFEPPGGMEKVAVSKLVGPTQPSHPWEKMLGGKKPEVGTLAVCVPEDYYFAEFRSVARLHEVLGAGELWAGHIFTQALGGARSQRTAERIRTQLGLSALPPAALDKLGIDAVAVTGSDPFLSEGSDVTLLATGAKVGELAQLADSVKGGKVVNGEHVGIPYTHRTGAGGVTVYAASPRPTLHLRGNSLPAFKRVLEAVAGKGADGKAVRRLGETAEFRYVRTRMVRGPEEDGFVYLSDAFIRNLTGPRLKLTERRRMLAYNHLRMIGHAALLFRSEFGRAPKSLEELAEKKCAPGVFGTGELAHPDGGTYSLSDDGMTGVCSKFGRADSLAPCVERLVTEVSGAEAGEYTRFVEEYSRYWRQFFDPIAVRVTLTPKQYKLETLVLPLIDNSIYSALAREVGKPVPMDLLPTPKREVGGVWLPLPKETMLAALTPDAPAAVSPLAKIRAAAERTTAGNNLKLVGLALLNYESAFAVFPDDIRDKAGKPLLSWRVAILPFIEQDNLYKQFKLDEPWDSDHNKKLLARMPPVYAGRDKHPAGKTGFLRPSGKGTAFVAGQKLKIANITDGTSNTVAVVESDTSVEWTKPADLPLDPKQPLAGVRRKAGEPFLVLMFDGSVRAGGPNPAPAAWRQALDPADGQPGGLDDDAEPPPSDTRPKLPVQVSNDLKQIGLAVHSYHDANGRLPTTNLRDKAGKPLLSWRVAILPFIEQDALYKQFKLDEPWDSDHNKKLLAKMPALFAGPDAKRNAEGKTHYLIPSGKNTLSPAEDARLTLVGITDGTANTILAVVADPARAVPWTKPEDLPFDPKEPLKGVVTPGKEWIATLMADGSTKRLSARITPARFAALVTPAGGETVAFEPGEEAPAQPGANPGFGLRELLPWFRLTADDLARTGVDPAILRRLLKDGIGDQIGVHIHDAPRLLDADLSGLFGGGESAGLTGIGLMIRFVFGPTSVSIPVKDAKAVDQFLDALDKLFLANRQDLGSAGLLWRRDVDFYTVPFPNPHKIRCAVANFAGLKWRVYWGRIGTGLYFATRPFILEDIAAAQAAGKKPTPSESAHAVLRVRPENWKDVLPGYSLGWAEASRAACHANLDMLANTNRGWNDGRPAAGPPKADLIRRVDRVFGERPYCPEGGAYELSPDGRRCQCSVHGGHDDPKQPAAPTAASATGKLLKTFAGVNAAIRFESDGLRVTVTVERK